MPAADAFRREGRRHPDGDGREIKKKQPQAETYIYPGAAHGFYCDERASYNKDAADLAWKPDAGISRQAYEEITHPPSSRERDPYPNGRTSGCARTTAP